MLSIFKQNTTGLENAPLSEDTRLAGEMRNILDRIETTETLFNMTSDMDMIDYYIHQLKALEAQYTHLLKEIRELRRTETAIKSRIDDLQTDASLMN